MTTLQVGKANYSANKGEKLVYYRLGMKDNQRELTVRIAPPIKDLADKGHSAVYVKQHFGYSLAGKSDKRIIKKFSCIERKDRNRNITQNCPECDETALRKADIAAREAKLKADGVASEVVEAQLRPSKAWLKEHNCDQKWNFLAKNEQGTWGFLAISHTCWEGLQREIKEIATLGFEDPFGVENGVWFRFSRTGTSFNDITDKAVAVKTSLGKGSFGIKTDTLTATDFAALEALPSLSTLGTRLTYEQIGMLVQSGGDEEVVKSVFQSSAPRSETSPVRTNTPSRTVHIEAPPLSFSAPVVTEAPKAVAPAPSEVGDLQAQLAALQAKLATMNVAAVSPAPAKLAAQPTPSPALTRSLDMNVDQFLQEFATPDEE